MSKEAEKFIRQFKTDNENGVLSFEGIAKLMQAFAEDQLAKKLEEIRQWLIDEDYEGLAERL